MELKYDGFWSFLSDDISFNRTFMELKWDIPGQSAGFYPGFNRTFMELKLLERREKVIL